MNGILRNLRGKNGKISPKRGDVNMPVSMDVRTSVRKEGIPRKSLGKVVGFTQDHHGVFVDFGDGQQTVFANNEFEYLEVEASHGQVERTRMQYGNEYARTGLPDEMLQVKYHIRDLIDAGYSPMFMERHLVTDMGFNSNLFRDAFQKCCGAEFEDMVNFPYLDTPGSIPGLNLGWGHAKDGKTIVFIMAGTTDYMCIRQVDDMTRHELHRHKTLKDAIDCAKKLTKKLMRWDPPVKENKDLDVVPSELYRQPQLFRQAMVDSGNGIGLELFDRVSAVPSPTHRKEIVDSIYLAAGIDKETHDQFLVVFCDDAKDSPKDELQEEAVKEVQEEAVEEALKSPGIAEVGEASRIPSDMPVNVMEVVTNFFAMKNQELKNFEVRQGELTYKPLGPPPKEIDQIGESSVAAATALVKVAVDVFDKSAPDSPRHAMMAFTVTGDEVKESNDSIKDIETSKIYGLTDEGLSDYFGK